MKGQEGVAFEYRDGRIQRNIDTDSIAVIDGVRYRKPKRNIWRYLSPMLLVVVVFILFWRLRRSQNQ